MATYSFIALLYGDCGLNFFPWLTLDVLSPVMWFDFIYSLRAPLSCGNRGIYGIYACMLSYGWFERNGTVVFENLSMDLSSWGVFIILVASWSKNVHSLSCYSSKSFCCNLRSVSFLMKTAHKFS